MNLFIKSVNQMRPHLTIFGGDSVVKGNSEQLRYIQESLVSRLDNPARFVIGNHDLVQSPGESDPLFKQTFPEPFYYEDVGKIRLVYLLSFRPEDYHQGLSDEQLEFLERTLDNSYELALVFLHHGLWLLDLPSTHVNSLAAGVPEPGFWTREVLPLLEEGNVAAVFGGDGGVNKSTLFTDLCGIPHYLTGWSQDLRHRPAEFLQLVVEQGEIEVLPYVMFDGKLFRSPAEEVGLPSQPECQRNG